MLIVMGMVLLATLRSGLVAKELLKRWYVGSL
jgi:hypothetical protein